MTGIVEIKLGAARADDPLPRALIPGGPYDTRAQRTALRRLGSRRRGPWARRVGSIRRPARDRPPRSTAHARRRGRPAASGRRLRPRAGEADRRRARGQLPVHPGPSRLGEDLQRRPPDLPSARRAARGWAWPPTAMRRSTTCSPKWRSSRGQIRTGAALKKPSGSEDSQFRSERRPLIENSDDIGDFTSGEYRLVAGTAWLFAREELDGQLDYLFVDEAGQVSLADALAIGTSARNLDPARRPAAARPGLAGHPSARRRRLGARPPARRQRHDSGGARPVHRPDAPHASRRLPLHLRGDLRGPARVVRGLRAPGPRGARGR